MGRLLTATEEFARIGTWERDLRSGETLWSDGMYRLLGMRPDATTRDENLILDAVHPDDRGRLRGLLATVNHQPKDVPEEGLTAEFRIIRYDGSVRDARARGHIELDQAGAPAYWIGVLQDVSDLRLTERELQAHYCVSQALRDWETFEEGAVDLLRRLGTALEYPMGTLWVWSPEQGALRCRALWAAPDVDPGEFGRAKRTLTFAPGEGKPGMAWQTQQPVITPDAATDPTFKPRRETIARGVSSAAAFPAVGDDGPVAILSFYSFESRVVSASLVRTLTGIGRELGRFLDRRPDQLGAQPVSERELDVLRLAADGNGAREIAERLFISPTTVKSHLEHIYEKLGVSDRAAAVAQGLRHGLIR